jgi:transposase
LGRIRYVPPVWLPPRPVRELRLVVRLRQQLVNERRAVKLRIGAIGREQRVLVPGRRWSAPWLAAVSQHKELSEQGRWVVQQHVRRLAWLAEELERVETHLESLAADDWMVRRLMTIKGIGLVTAAVMRAEIGSFTRFRSAKSMARFCCLTPRNVSSGARQSDGGMIKAGNPILRMVLIEAAHRLKRFDPRWKALADSLRARGKPGPVIAVAVANRWIRSLHHEGRLIEPAAA